MKGEHGHPEVSTGNRKNARARMTPETTHGDGCHRSCHWKHSQAAVTAFRKPQAGEGQGRYFQRPRAIARVRV